VALALLAFKKEFCMTNAIKIASENLLAASDISPRALENILDKTLTRTVDAADIYLEKSLHEEWYLEDSLVKGGDFSIDYGFGLRVVCGEKTGFAFADDITLTSLSQAANSAKSIAYSGNSGAISVAKTPKTPALYTDKNPLPSLADQEKINLLHTIDQYARSLDPRVKQVFVRLSAEYDVILIVPSDAAMCADIRPLVNLSIRVVVEDKKMREQGTAGGGNRTDYQYFLKEGLYKKYAEKAVFQAIQNLTAKPAPAGTMPVVLGPGWPGVLLHEAIGHGLEADFNRKGSSAFSGKLGEKVASEFCTIVDDGTLPDRRGSLTIDDEGTPTEKTVLIEKGILKNYMQDKLNARLMNMAPTGNARRESYAHLPIPRMTNTYMLAGEHDPAEIIASVKNGIYAVDFAGGQVDITSGKFVFTANEAYLIENGKVTSPIKGATLIGHGPDILTRVSMVGHDLELDAGLGTCGKEGQSVPVGVGQPTLKIDSMTVGGSGN
jgi:TldD protein